MKTPFIKAVGGVLYKDLVAEFRSRELISSMIVFALLSLLIFSFALELDRIARTEAISGVLWVTVSFASVLGLNRSLAIEREQSGLEAMLIAPIDRGAIFIGKSIGNFVFALVVGLLLIPLMTVLFNNSGLLQGWLLLVLILGTLGLTTVGTLLATMTVQTRSRETLLPIVMLPMALPVVLASVKASTAIISGTALNDWSTWLGMLFIINLVYFVACWFMFDFVVEE